MIRFARGFDLGRIWVNFPGLHFRRDRLCAITAELKMNHVDECHFIPFLPIPYLTFFPSSVVLVLIILVQCLSDAILVGLLLGCELDSTTYLKPCIGVLRFNLRSIAYYDEIDC